MYKIRLNFIFIIVFLLRDKCQENSAVVILITTIILCITHYKYFVTKIIYTYHVYMYITAYARFLQYDATFWNHHAIWEVLTLLLTQGRSSKQIASRSAEIALTRKT